MNLPSARMMKETDYCGLVSGREVDKEALFPDLLRETEYGAHDPGMPGQHGGAGDSHPSTWKPMKSSSEISREPIVTRSALRPARAKISPGGPDLFSMSGGRYFRLGEQIGLAWNAGRELKTKEVTLNTPPAGGKRIKKGALLYSQKARCPAKSKKRWER